MKKIRNLSRFISFMVCICIMIVGCLAGSMFFFRPSESVVEKRTLTAFPTFTFATFMNGEFFSDVALWYADTYPNRDNLISLSQDFKSLYGIEQSTMMVGGNVQADSIPSEQSDSTEAKVVKVPDQYSFDEDMQNQLMSGLYVKDGAAYSVYYYSQSAADIYIKAMNKAAKTLDGTTNVYSLLVPNNSILLDDDEYAKLGGSDMKQAIDYYYNSYKNVTGIDLMPYIEKNIDDYLYFRTDHHWTALGAYQAYKAYCKEKGWKAHKLSSLETMEFSPFLGTFYNELQLSDMEENPDKVIAYIPNSTNDMIYYDEDGNENEWQIITDVSDWNEGSGYYCFIGGDKPLSIIDNPDKDNGKSVLVVKESYGNSFVPFLVDHYDKVYIADFRYTDINVVDFCKENDIDDLIFENNLTIIGSDEVASKIYDLVA